jgi:16S rRNA (guanine(527)-N(7))-methyltransferase RsmG
VKLVPDLICKTAGIQHVDAKKLTLSQRFCEAVLEANRKINLVSRAGEAAQTVERQFLLSIAALDRIPDTGGLKWLDIGSGGGFPAIPLAIFRPDISFVLVESIAKKAFFLERTLETLRLPNVSVTQERLDHRRRATSVPNGAFDWVSVKAVAEWDTSLEWGKTYLRPGGCLLTYKSVLIRAAESRALEKHNFKMLSSMALIDRLPEAGLHIFVVRKND